MNPLKHFEQTGRRGFYRPVAVVTFDQAVTMCADAMQHARALNLTDLVLNTMGLNGFAPPDIFARYEMVNRWVSSAGASLSVAVVARPEIVDPQKIGLLMAQNR